MNRRNFLAGSISLAWQQKLLPFVEVLSPGGQSTQKTAPPQNLLSTTFPEEFLEKNLIPVNEWHPYPRWGERGPWEEVPTDIRATFVEQAETDQKAGWRAFLVTTFLEFTRNGNRTDYDAENCGRRARLLHLVLAECMEGKGRFVDEIVNGVWLICEESYWGNQGPLRFQRAGLGLPDVTDPIIELDGGETAQLLAWTRYLVGERLDKVSPLINKRIILEVERRILIPARTRNDFWWMGFEKNTQTARLNNWTPWLNSNLMVANLFLEEDPKLRVYETTRILKSLDAYLNQYWPDAGDEEGPEYFHSSPLCYFEAVNMINEATGNSTNVLLNPFINAMGRYILSAHVCDDTYTNYGDSLVHAGPEGELLYRFGKAVQDEQLKLFGAYLAAQKGWTAKGAGLTKVLNELDDSRMSMSRALSGVLVANEVRHARREDVLLRDSWYPDLGFVTARLKEGSPMGLYFADLASNNGRSHGHNDTGSYIIYQDCEPVAIDVGPEAYNAKTFGPDRYKIWVMQSAYHNLPTIGGVMQHAGLQYKATERKYVSNGERTTFSFNIAEAYPKEAGVTSWVRTITLDRIHDIIRVEEAFELERAAPVTLSIMTPRIVTVNQNGSITLRLVAANSNASLLKYDETQITPTVETIVLEDSWLRMSWGDRIYRILFNSTRPVVCGRWSYEFRHA